MEAGQTPIIVSLASTLHYIVGFDFTLGSIPFALYTLINRRLPDFLGIRFYGGSFIERSGGFEAILYSSFASLLISSINILAAYWLSRSLRIGGVLGLALFPVSMFFALGFGAPIPIILHPLMAVSIILSWSALK